MSWTACFRPDFIITHLKPSSYLTDIKRRSCPLPYTILPAPYATPLLWYEQTRSEKVSDWIRSIHRLSKNCTSTGNIFLRYSGIVRRREKNHANFLIFYCFGLLGSKFIFTCRVRVPQDSRSNLGPIKMARKRTLPSLCATASIPSTQPPFIWSGPLWVLLMELLTPSRNVIGGL